MLFLKIKVYSHKSHHWPFFSKLSVVISSRKRESQTEKGGYEHVNGIHHQFLTSPDISNSFTIAGQTKSINKTADYNKTVDSRQCRSSARKVTHLDKSKFIRRGKRKFTGFYCNMKRKPPVLLAGIKPCIKAQNLLRRK